MTDNYTKPIHGGITGYHRELLSRLHRDFKQLFSNRQAAACLDLPAQRTSWLLAYWASRGWLARFRRGVYATIPLDAAEQADWRRDPWIVAHTIFHPCYIGGWSAAEHWGLTEQIFTDIAVFSAGDVRRRLHVIKGTRFIVTPAPRKRMAHLKPAWRENVSVSVSSPAQTVIDILDKPRLGGGIRHAAQIVAEFFGGEHRDEKDLIDYARTVGNRTVCKRLGFIIETLGLDGQESLKFCRKNVSAGYSRFDPGVRRKGRLLRRWNLEVNADLFGLHGTDDRPRRDQGPGSQKEPA